MKTALEKFNDCKDRYVSNFKRTNGSFCDASVSYEDGFVIIKTKIPSSSSGTGKHRITEFERMTLTLESRPDYIKPKQSFKKIAEGEININNTDTEDGGQARMTTLNFCDTPEESDNGMFVTVQSWDDTKKHEEFKKFEGRKIRITIETID